MASNGHRSTPDMSRSSVSSSSSAALTPPPAMKRSSVSPWRSHDVDSPSRQLLYDLAHLSLEKQRQFTAKLDEEAKAWAEQHNEALANAAAEHDAIRRKADIARHKVELQMLEQRKRDKETEDALIKERIRKEAEEAAAEEKRLEERERERRDAQAREEERRRREESRRLSQEQETQRLEAEREQRARAERETQRASQERPTTTTTTQSLGPNVDPPSITQPDQTLISPSPAFIQPGSSVSASATVAPTHTTSPATKSNLETLHSRYLEIHQNLKALRKDVVEAGKRDPDLKKKMGEARREIRKLIGQLNSYGGYNPKLEKEATSENSQRLRKIRDIIKGAVSSNQPQIDVTKFVLNPPPNHPNTSVPILLVYLLNVFSKMSISQLLGEAAVSLRSANPIGIIASSIFATNELSWNNASLIDIMLAKFHVVCPVLFGINGNPKTNQGREKLGWKKEGDSFVTPQRHGERMTGLGAGFAALTLRNFDRNQLVNPCPPTVWWKSISNIINLPIKQVTETHFVVLKNLVAGQEKRILDFFGHFGKALMRYILVEWPKRLEALGNGEAKGVAAKALIILAEAMAEEKRLFL